MDDYRILTNGLTIEWGGQIRDAEAVYFSVAYLSYARVIISRVADKSGDPSSASCSVQPLPGESASSLKTGFIPRFGNAENGGHYLAIGYS